MVTGIIGRKVGMTQVFAQDGTVAPATVIKAGPCVVVQAKGAQTDGYEAVQLGLVEEKPAQGQQAARAATTRRPDVPPTRVRREVKLAKGGERAEGGRSGARRRRLQQRRSRGRHRHQPRQGLPGRREAPSLPRRRGDARLDVPSRAGSIGASSFPSRVVKGMRAAGRMGGDRVTVRNLKVVQIDGENNLLRHARRRAGRAGRLRRRAQGGGGEDGAGAAGGEAPKKGKK